MPSALLFSWGGLKTVKRDSYRWATVSPQDCCSHNVQIHCVRGKLQLRFTSEHPFHFSFVSFSPHPANPLSPYPHMLHKANLLSDSGCICVCCCRWRWNVFQRLKKKGKKKRKNDGGSKSSRKWQAAETQVPFYDRSTSTCSSAGCYSRAWLWWEHSCRGNRVNFTNSCIIRGVDGESKGERVCFTGWCFVQQPVITSFNTKGANTKWIISKILKYKKARGKPKLNSGKVRTEWRH